MQESPDDMPPGQTPHTVIVYAHGDLVDAVQPGDRVAVTGIYRAVPLKANPRARNLKAVYKTHIDVVHFRKTDNRRLRGGDTAEGSTEKEPVAVQFDEDRLAILRCATVLIQSEKCTFLNVIHKLCSSNCVGLKQALF